MTKRAKITGSSADISDLAKSYVRTIVPVAVGWVIAFALRHGLDLTGHAALVTTIVTVVYYAVARVLEHYVSPQFGWLLGLATRPLYAVGVIKGTKGTVATPAKG